MKEFEVTLPKLGESIMGATVVSWLKEVGDTVALDEPLLEVSTDKVNSEIPSPVAGVLREILVEEDEEIEIGAPLARLTIEGDETVAPPPAKREEAPCPLKNETLSPAVLRMAQVEGIDIATLQKIKGTGGGGRVTKKDVEHFLHAQRERSVPPPAVEGKEEHVKMSSMRKAIADNMVRSFYEAPHASLVSEADVTDIMLWIKENKVKFLETHGVKLTITSFIIQALTKALQKFPMVNASLQDETIVMKKYINMGLAVNVEKGLVVPVVKNCQERNIISIAKAVGDLSKRAREQKLAPDDVQDGTITLTNFGMTGALIGVPIIRYPEVAIIGVGSVQKRVVVREDDSMAVRQMVYLTLTFDHRIIDGIYGCQFLAAFKEQLESVTYSA
ncbi:MAG: 2-oxo acid dehydrogenase subunit E2 [Chlamydiales bacterium]|nr:2-oxo acid dehydrogenase subunit E2 [Chlamydiales bacterium]